MSRSDVPEPTLSAAARLLARRVGLRSDPSIRGRLSRSVADEAAALDLAAADYVSQLEGDERLLQKLLDRVTVQETAFFRDRAQFDALSMIARDLVSPVVAWSAGCSNGQEPYSIAMTLADSGIADWRVVATDVSSLAVARTRRAGYAERELTAVDPDRRQRFFVRSGSDWEVAAPMRARVEVLHQNLVADPPPMATAASQVIFCRNVLIYLRHDDVVTLLDRLAAWMSPSGWLFLGYSESLWHVTDRFQLVRVGDAFAYRRRDAPAVRAKEADHPRPSRLRPRRSTAARSRREPRPSVAPSTAPTTDAPSVALLLAEGEAAMNASDFVGAVATFRKAAYLDPDHPVAHLNLGLALEAGGAPAVAKRAYAAAMGCLSAGGSTTAVETLLEGYDPKELERLLRAKLSPSPRDDRP